MDRRTRRRLVCAMGFASLLLAAAPAASQTFVYTDIPDFNLTGTWTSYGGGTQYHISSTGDGTVSYRWVDVTPLDNIVSGNSCSDLSSFGQHYYNAGVTLYRQLFSGFSGLCFILRGETAGGGSMYFYDGRLQR